MKYLNNDLVRLKLNLAQNKLEGKGEYIVEVMKQLPSKLQDLSLQLSNNKFGNNSEDLKWLGEGMKFLPGNLKNLELNLRSNNILGDNNQNLIWLVEGMK